MTEISSGTKNEATQTEISSGTKNEADIDGDFFSS